MYDAGGHTVQEISDTFGVYSAHDLPAPPGRRQSRDRRRRRGAGAVFLLGEVELRQHLDEGVCRAPWRPCVRRRGRRSCRTDAVKGYAEEGVEEQDER